jgi:hypothetical protein
MESKPVRLHFSTKYELSGREPSLTIKIGNDELTVDGFRPHERIEGYYVCNLTPYAQEKIIKALVANMELK